MIRIRTAWTKWNRLKEKKPTIVDMHIWPQGCTFSNYTGLSSVQRSLDKLRDLLRTRVLDSGVDKRVMCDAVNGTRSNKIRFEIAYSDENPDEHGVEINSARQADTPCLSASNIALSTFL